MIDHMLKPNRKDFPDIEMRGKIFPWNLNLEKLYYTVDETLANLHIIIKISTWM